jgi:hypothetical protein
MEVIDLTLDLDDEKSSTSKDIDLNLFAAPIICPLVYTRNQTNAAGVPGGVLPAAFYDAMYSCSFKQSKQRGENASKSFQYAR